MFAIKHIQSVERDYQLALGMEFQIKKCRFY
jgi:hypothetical protein